MCLCEMDFICGNFTMTYLKLQGVFTSKGKNKALAFLAVLMFLLLW